MVKPISLKKSLSSRLAIGGVIAATTAIVGAAGVAAAAPMTSSSSPSDVVSMCKKDFHKLGSENVGSCVSEMKKHHGNGNGNGHGYGNGNGNNISTEINLRVNGNHNIISFVLNDLVG
jgi:hypothetical protein